MPHFRSKPKVIEAWQVGSQEPKPEWLRHAFVRDMLFGNGDDYYEIKTLEGTMRANRHDWVIRGVQGELYPCKPDIFAMTYEPAEPAPAE